MHRLFSKQSIIRALAVVLLAIGTTPGPAIGAPDLPGADETYAFYSNNQNLRETLEFFGRNTGIAVDIDPQVSGTMSDHELRDLSRKDYLEALAAEYGLVWFFDGTTLHVTVTGHVGTEIFPLKAIDGEQVIAALEAVDIFQPQFTHRFDSRNRIFMVSGPPAYVEIVKKAIDALENADRIELTVVRGTSDYDTQPPSTPGLPSAIGGMEAGAMP